MDKFRTIGLGGLPFTLDDFRWFFGRLGAPNEGIYQAFNNLLRGFGDNFIVQGCVLGGVSTAFTLTEGWIILDGELIKVDAQGPFNEATNSTFLKVTTFDSRGNKTFQNATIEDTYEKNRADISGSGGNLAFDGIRLGRWGQDDFDAADFTSDTGTWVPTGPTTQIRNFVLGKMMTVDIRITTSTIALGPTGFVKFKIPRDKTVSRLMTNLTKIKIATGPIVAILRTQPADDTILIQPLDETDIPNGSFEVSGQITFEID